MKNFFYTLIFSITLISCGSAKINRKTFSEKDIESLSSYISSTHLKNTSSIVKNADGSYKIDRDITIFEDGKDGKRVIKSVTKEIENGVFKVDEAKNDTTIVTSKDEAKEIVISHEKKRNEFSFDYSTSLKWILLIIISLIILYIVKMVKR